MGLLPTSKIMKECSEDEGISKARQEISRSALVVCEYPVTSDKQLWMKARLEFSESAGVFKY
jgi:hypothetical protein